MYQMVMLAAVMVAAPIVGCNAIGDAFMPPLNGTAETDDSRTKLDIVTVTQIEDWRDARDARTATMLHSDKYDLAAWGDPAATLQPAAVSRALALHRTQPATPPLPFRCGEAFDPADPATQTALREFLSCTGQLTRTDEAIFGMGAGSAVMMTSAADMFAMGAAVAIKALGEGLKKESTRYRAEYSAFGTGSLYVAGAQAGAVDLQTARLIQITRAATSGDDKAVTPAMCLVIRVDIDASGQAVQLKPVSLRVNRTYAKVAGMQQDWATSYGLLWPWMWGHGVYALFDQDVFDVDLSVTVETDVVRTWDKDHEAAQIGSVDFKLPSVDARNLPFERTCYGNGIAVPSPYLPLPSSDPNLASVPMNVRISVTEANDLGKALNTVSGLLSDNSEDISKGAASVLGFSDKKTDQDDAASDDGGSGDGPP